MTDQTTDILLLGGGIASANAAAELREQGYDGSIVLVTREMDAPYHRPPLTKGYLQGREDRASTLIHPEGWYDEHDIDGIALGSRSVPELYSGALDISSVSPLLVLPGS